MSDQIHRLDLFVWLLGSFTGPGRDQVTIEFCGRPDRQGLAVLSEDERFRHVLAWVWDEALPVLFVEMLNPSTARAFSDDQTMRKVFEFARRNGYGGVVVINQCDFRATKPTDAKAAGWPTTGFCKQLETRVLNELRAGEARRDLLLAWGNYGPRLEGWAVGRRRDRRVRLLHLGLTKQGKPEHPVMLPYSRELTEFGPCGLAAEYRAAPPP